MATTTAAPIAATRPARPQSRTARRVGWVLTGFSSAFLAFDVAIHLLNVEVARAASVSLGFRPEATVVFGVLGAICLALYLFRPTAVLGAVLETAYLGGALCAQLRVDAPVFTTLLFPVYVAVIVWAGLWLRDEQVRALLPVRRSSDR